MTMAAKISSTEAPTVAPLHVGTVKLDLRQRLSSQQSVLLPHQANMLKVIRCFLRIVCVTWQVAKLSTVFWFYFWRHAREFHGSRICRSAEAGHQGRCDMDSRSTHQCFPVGKACRR